MKEILDNIPWSGVAFIVLSVIFSVYWLNHQSISFLYLIISETILFIICFRVVNWEANHKPH